MLSDGRRAEARPPCDARIKHDAPNRLEFLFPKGRFRALVFSRGSMVRKGWLIRGKFSDGGVACLRTSILSARIHISETRRSIVVDPITVSGLRAGSWRQHHHGPSRICTK